jgi:hypothetical protein
MEFLKKMKSSTSITVIEAPAALAFLMFLATFCVVGFLVLRIIQNGNRKSDTFFCAAFVGICLFCLGMMGLALGTGLHNNIPKAALLNNPHSTPTAAAAAVATTGCSCGCNNNNNNK